MSKMKTHSGTAKRIKKTASGKIKTSHSQRGHLKTAKSSASKRRNSKPMLVSKSDAKRMKQQISQVK